MRHIHFDVIDSTQKEAWRMYASGAKEILITARIQTDAIGTHGRRWYTEVPDNLAFSLLLTPGVNVKRLKNLTTDTALIIQKILKEYGFWVEIKKPNDLMINNKKVGGILLETKTERQEIKALVLGIGINVSNQKFNTEIKDIATSISNEYGKTIDINVFINDFFNNFMQELKERKIICK